MRKHYWKKHARYMKSAIKEGKRKARKRGRRGQAVTFWMTLAKMVGRTAAIGIAKQMVKEYKEDVARFIRGYSKAQWSRLQRRYPVLHEVLTEALE